MCINKQAKMHDKILLIHIGVHGATDYGRAIEDFCYTGGGGEGFHLFAELALGDGGNENVLFDTTFNL